MTAVVLRGDARNLPLPDESVDLICTSPPFLNLRSYTDNGQHYDGQVGTGARAQFLNDLWECTAEMARVLKPSGSMFVELGDSYTDKCLNDTPHRYVIGCVDKLGLILRAEIIYHRVNGLPESVTDRVRRAHSVVFHLVRQPRYYAAVDSIREPHQPQSVARTGRRYNAGDLFSVGTPNTLDPAQFCNPLGKLPGSVWDIPSQPLTVPAWLGVQHFAAFPMELPRRCILGWSPPGICVACGEGRRPVTQVGKTFAPRPGLVTALTNAHGADGREGARPSSLVSITGYACACTPYTDHPGTGERDTGDQVKWEPGCPGHDSRQRQVNGHLGNAPRVGPWREYHQDWTPPPTRPAVVVDPFAGTGTTMLVASALGRTGIGVDRSMDYARLAKWRTADPGERAKALGVPKPPRQVDGQGDLFEAVS